MKTMQTLKRISAASTALLLAAALTGCGPQRGGPDASAQGAKITVIGQSKGIQFWDYVEQGAMEAAEELGYVVDYMNAESTSDIDSQIEFIHSAIENGTQAIVVAPNSASALNEAIRDAGDAGIPVITIDADVDNASIRKSYIGTQNASAGAIAARKALEYLQEHMEGASIGKVGIIGHSETSSAAQQRIGGFRGELASRLAASFKAIKAGDQAPGGNSGMGAPEEGGAPEIDEEAIAAAVDVTGMSEEEAKEAREKAVAEAKAKAAEEAGGAPEGGQGGAPSGMSAAQMAAEMNPVAEVVFCNGEADTARQQAKDMLEKYPNIQVLYATNERSTVGVCEAVKDLGLAGQIMVIGFNSNTAEIENIRNDVLTATMVQNPYNMGYLGVYYAGNAVSGSSVPGNIDTGVTYVDKAHLSDTSVAMLLDPTEAVKEYAEKAAAKKAAAQEEEGE